MQIAKLCVVSVISLFNLANSLDARQRMADGVADAMPAIRRANSEWMAAMRTGDADAIAEPYASSAVFVTADGECIHGRTSIRDFYRARLGGKSAIVSATIEHQAAATGDRGLVYEWGVGIVTARAEDGSLVTRRSAYLTVWQREEDGRWAIARNVVM